MFKLKFCVGVLINENDVFWYIVLLFFLVVYFFCLFLIKDKNWVLLFGLIFSNVFVNVEFENKKVII